MPQRLITHHAASHYTAIAILAALMARERTGRGQHLDVSNADAVVGVPYETEDPFITGRSPAWNLYETADGRYVAVGARDQRTWANFCRAIGREQWASRLTDEAGWDAMRAELQQVFKGRTRDQWWQFFQDKDTAVAPVLHLDEVPADRQVQQREMLVELDVPDGGKALHAGIAMKLRGTPGQIRTLAPAENQHTDEILRSLGYDASGIRQLHAAGAVQ